MSASTDVWRERSSTALVALTAFSVAAAFLYAPVVAKLARDWWTIPDYSHGFLVTPLAALLVWWRRDELARTRRAPSNAGLVLVVGSLVLLILGTLAAELFLTRVSLLAFAAGCILFLFGWAHLRMLAFPLILVALTIPIPAIIISRLTLSLQLWASTIAESLLWVFRIPVLREGNVLVLPNATLQVAEACSGIRSMTALVTLALVVARFGETRWLPRAAIVASAIPIAVLVNGLRVTASAVGARWFGVAAVEGTVHEVLGWLMFLVAFALMAACARVVGGSTPGQSTKELAVQ
jgi:exosortase